MTVHATTSRREPVPRERRWRRLAAIPFAMAMMLGVGVVGVSSASAPQVSADTVLSGTVTRDGEPVRDAQVLAVAWPNSDVLDALAEDELVDARIVARAQADRAGRFVLDLDPAAVGPDHMQRDGGVDLEIAIADDRNEALWHFTATPPDEAGRGVAEGQWTNGFLPHEVVAARRLENKAPTHIVVDLGAGTIVEEGNEPEEWVGPDNRPLGPVAAQAAATVPLLPRRLAFEGGDVKPHNGPICPGYVGTSQYDLNRRESFTRSIGTIQVYPQVIQTTSASHQLGVAYRVGSSGSWSQSGTLNRSTGASSTRHMGYTNLVYNRVNYRLFANHCQTGTRYQWRPHSFHSLNTDQAFISRPNSWTSSGCTRYTGPSGPHEKIQGANATFSSGVQLGIASVSAKASFTHNVKMRWTVYNTGAHNGGRLCSSNSFGWASSSAPQAGGFIP